MNPHVVIGAGEVNAFGEVVTALTIGIEVEGADLDTAAIAVQLNEALGRALADVLCV